MSISPAKIVTLRKDRGWSQEKLATMSGVSERTIQRAEKDGSCSLETKLALAAVFEISPTELSGPANEGQAKQSVTYKTDWSGALGLFVLGLLAPAMVLLTATEGQWELTSAAIVWGLTIVIVMMNFGAKATYNFFDKTSWIVKHPSYVQGLNHYISLGNSVIKFAYIIGIAATIVTSLTIAVHAPEMLGDKVKYFSIVIRPLVHAMLFNELWIRPYKSKMERMWAMQLSTSKS